MIVIYPGCWSIQVVSKLGLLSCDLQKVMLSPERHLKQTYHKIWTGYTHLTRLAWPNSQYVPTPNSEAGCAQFGIGGDKDVSYMSLELLKFQTIM